MTPPTQTNEVVHSKRASRLILLSVCLGQALVGLDQRALTVALPTLTTTFNTAFTTIQWTILVYDLVLIGLIITMGRLGDMFGRRRFYSLGFLIFVTASAICGMTQTTGQLIFFRAVQAIGGSMIAANGRAIVSVNLPAEERGRALGLTSTAFHIGFLIGPALGGFLIDGLGWRWIFYINMPFSLAGAYLAWKVVPETRMHGKTSVDFAGALLLLLTNGLFIYAIDQLPRVGWRHPAFFLTLTLAAVALVFLLRAESRAKLPILVLSMFRARLFSAGIASLFVLAATLSAINFLLPFYLQSLLGYSAIADRLDHRRRLGDHHGHGAHRRRAIGSSRLASALHPRLFGRCHRAVPVGIPRPARAAAAHHAAAGALGRRLVAIQCAQSTVDFKRRGDG